MLAACGEPAAAKAIGASPSFEPGEGADARGGPPTAAKAASISSAPKLDEEADELPRPEPLPPSSPSLTRRWPRAASQPARPKSAPALVAHSEPPFVVKAFSASHVFGLDEEAVTPGGWFATAEVMAPPVLELNEVVAAC